jgi:hypothetical protein
MRLFGAIDLSKRLKLAACEVGNFAVDFTEAATGRQIGDASPIGPNGSAADFLCGRTFTVRKGWRYRRALAIQREARAQQIVVTGVDRHANIRPQESGHRILGGLRLLCDTADRQNG